MEAFLQILKKAVQANYDELTDSGYGLAEIWDELDNADLAANNVYNVAFDLGTDLNDIKNEYVGHMDWGHAELKNYLKGSKGTVEIINSQSLIDGNTYTYGFDPDPDIRCFTYLSWSAANSTNPGVIGDGKIELLDSGSSVILEIPTRVDEIGKWWNGASVSVIHNFVSPRAFCFGYPGVKNIQQIKNDTNFDIVFTAKSVYFPELES